MKHHEEFLALVEDARTRIKELSVMELITEINSSTPPQLIDVREETEWDQGHLPDAIHLCKGTIERDIVDLIPQKEAALVLYCGGGFRSALAADAIQKMGYKNVWSLKGGFGAWRKEGLLVVSD